MWAIAYVSHIVEHRAAFHAPYLTPSAPQLHTAEVVRMMNLAAVAGSRHAEAGLQGLKQPVLSEQLIWLSLACAAHALHSPLASSYASEQIRLIIAEDICCIETHLTS